ncbi:MAG: hypothetical protein LBB94_00340 [Clostridiales bacterium]|nr:hypothetical protein [Clostridiales bacterium]
MRKLILLFVCIIVIALFPVKVMAEDIDPADIGFDYTENEDTAMFDSGTVYHVPWPFAVYDEPNFSAEILEKYEPQNVTVLEMHENGWAFVSTYKGLCWAYLKENMINVDKQTLMYLI